jgi:hypothetical protein
LHRHLQPETYLEIGTLHGNTLSVAQCAAICIDPLFQLTVDPIAQRPATMFFQMTSDRFFQRYSPSTLLGKPIEIAFLDGLHEAETLLRDFANVEKHCRRNSLICLHDCIPENVPMATRYYQPPMAWTGDVWKVVPILKKWRPDVSIFVFDAYPTGLVCCTNLDSSSSVLDDEAREIWQEWRPIELSEYGFNRMIEEAAIVSTDEIERPDQIRRYFWL